MEIKSYLLELIAIRKKIGINALGTLYKKKTPGRYDFQTHSFLPPKYEITFDNQESDDQELANFISEKRNISTDSANYYINEFVEQIKAQLADDQYADFSPFGELRLINEHIVFEPSENTSIDHEFYGLPSIEATNSENKPVVEDPDQHTKETASNAQSSISSIEETMSNDEEQAEEDPVYDEISELKIDDTAPKVEKQENEHQIIDEPEKANAIEEHNEYEERIDINAPSQVLDPQWKPTVIEPYHYDDDEEGENKNKGLRIFLKTLLILFIIAIAGAGMYLFFPNLFNGLNNNHTSEQAESTPIAIDTSLTQKIDSPIVDTVKKENTQPTIINDGLKPQTIVYEVIGSAMKTQKKVDEVIAILSKRGIAAKQLEAMPGNLIKISLGTFTDFKLAKKYQDSLRIKLKNPEIYIQTIKPKN